MKPCGNKPQRKPTRRKTHEEGESTQSDHINPEESVSDDEDPEEIKVGQQSSVVSPTTTTPTAPADQKEPAESSASMWIAIIFAILLLIGGGLGVSYWLGYIKKEHFSFEFIRLWKLPIFTKE